MKHIDGYCREQQLMFPETIGQYISEENPVRFIDAFVDSLDLESLCFEKAHPAATGRPSYDPKDLLKLYIYGYLNRIRSSRRLEQEAHRNVELIWLLRMLRPDFKTIADFRKNNLEGLKGLFRQFILLCKELDLFGAELIAIDGSKFKAVNSTNCNFTKAKLKKRLKVIDEKVEQYLEKLETSDQEESEVQPVTKKDLEQKIERLKERKGRYGELLKQMEERGDSQISLTDPDSRSMPKSPKVNVGYNVQVAVDARHKLIVDQDVTNAVSDNDLLSPMAIKAKEALGVEHIQVVADMGYYHGKEVKTCEEAGIEVYISRPYTSANTKLGLFGKERFAYDPEQDCYLCPAGEQLQFRFETFELGRQIRYYATSACRQCPIKSRCTRSKSGRRITRWIDEHILERMEERLKANPQIMNQRKQIVEHPFGTIKHTNNQGYFLMKGLEKVQGEFSLSALVYNMKRVINIVGVPKLMAALFEGGSYLFSV